MTRRFKGEWTHKVDGKGRVSVPAPFRKLLQRQDPDWETESDATRLVLVRSRPSRPCYDAFSIEEMDAIDDLVYRLPKFSREREVLSRLLSSRAKELSLDENGRILMGQPLRDAVGVGETALFAGMGDRFQIWDPSAYEADNAGLADWVKEEDADDDLFAQLHKVQERFEA